MVPGFKTRLLQELKYLISTCKDFEEIRAIEENFNMFESCFPPNCLAWAGASIISQLNSEIDKFEITQKDYVEKYSNGELPDRFGEAFLYGYTRNDSAPDSSSYFNREFEEFMKAQK